MNGNTRMAPGGSGGAVQFGPAGGETGMSITGGNRADVRFDGSTLKLLVGAGTGAMASTNGININTIGNVGIGTTTPGAKLEVITTSGNGVSSTSSSAAGYGLYARNTAGGQAMHAECNVAQSRDKGGFVKAMVFVNADGTIARCYNSTLIGSTSSTVPCGIQVTHTVEGVYEVNFGFKVDDRFVSITGYYSANFPSVGTVLVESGNVVTVAMFDAFRESTQKNAPFVIVIY